MFLILPFLLMTGLLSFPILLILISVYGVGLILVAQSVENVRQETSRDSLRQFLNVLAIDHVASAALGVACGVLLMVSSLQDVLPSLEEGGDTAAIAALSLGLSVVWGIMAVIFWMISGDLAKDLPVYEQLKWQKWLNFAVKGPGAFFGLSTAGMVHVICAPLFWHNSHSAKMSRQSSLIWTLVIAVRQGLSLGQEVLSLSDGYWGKHRQRLIFLAENLDAGMPLSMALERQPGMVPRSSVMLIRVGEDTQMLTAALERCAVGYANRHERESDFVTAQQAFFTLTVPVLAIPLIVSFVMYFIIPKFKKIFEDFGTELPAVTISLITSADILVKYNGFPVIMMAGLGCMALLTIVNSRDWELDWPLLDTLAPRVNGPPILRAISLVIAEGRPIVDGVKAMAWSHPRKTARVRLMRLHASLERGGGLAESLASEHLIRQRDVALLHAAERVRNLPFCMDQLAANAERRFWFRLQSLMEIGYPVTIFLLGIVVFFVSAAFFAPLVKLLNDLS